jgi:Tfp pilus assembly PilM family ATPase
MQQADLVREALEQLARSLAIERRRVSLMLPDGVGRVLLLEVPRGTRAPDFARFQLARGSPYPEAEAVVATMPVGRARVLAVAVRRSLIESYEAVAAAAGLAQGLLSLAPLAAVAGLSRGSPGNGLTADLILSDSALSLAVSEAGMLRAYRSRRRDPGPGEAERLAEEIARTTALLGHDGAARVRVVGPGAGDRIRELRGLGWAVEAGWPASEPGLEAVEHSWLGAAAG